MKKIIQLFSILLIGFSFLSCTNLYEKEKDKEPLAFNYVSFYYLKDNIGLYKGSLNYVDILVQISNGDAKNVQVEFSTNSPYVTVNNPKQTLGNIDDGYWKSIYIYKYFTYSYKNGCTTMSAAVPAGQSGLSINVSDYCPPGSRITFYLKFTADDRTEVIKELTATVIDKPKEEKPIEEVPKPEPEPDTNPSISKDFWGTWIQMDTGDEYYIDDNAVYKLSYNKKTKIQDGIGNYKLESPEVIKNGNSAYFRKGGYSRSFSVGLSGFSGSLARAIGIGTQNISGRRKNKENASDTQKVEATVSDNESTLLFNNAVPGDTQTVEVIVESTTAATVDVIPQYDGENMGTIPLVEKNKYALKTSYTIDSKLDDYMYGNDYAEYDITLKIENISEQQCDMSFYTISWDDSNLKLTIPREGNIRTLLKDDSSKLKGKVSYGKLEDEYKDVVVNIRIEDGYGDDSWNDSVTLRFYRGRVPVVVNAKVVDGSDAAKLNGFVVYPDGRSKWFTVQSGKSSTVWIPYSKSDYVLAFSGATTTSEMKYSFNYRNYSTLADLSGFVTRDEIKAYEPNNIFNEANDLGCFTETVKAALSYGDFDFYKINNQNQPMGNLASIKIDSSAMQTTYYLNQNLNTEGLVVKAVYEDGQEVDISKYVKISNVDMTTLGTKNLEISYTENGITKSEKIYITVSDFIVSSISIVEEPLKLVYWIGQKFDPSGIIVNATIFNAEAPDGEIIDVTNSVEYEGFDSSEIGEQVVTVSYTKNGITKSEKIYITVNDFIVSSISIVKKPLKLVYWIGQKFDPNGIIVNATIFNAESLDGEIIDVTNSVEYDGFDSSEIGEQVVTVSYTKDGITNTTTFNIMIKNPPYEFTSVPIKITDPEITKNLSLGTEGTYYYFGDWPQSLAENPPVNEEEGPAYNGWYNGYDGNYYAKVSADPYDDYSFANGTRIKEGATYYFKVEPIKWRVLTTDYNGTGNALWLAEDILTANIPYYENGFPHSNRSYANNYKDSQIRAYLNGISYNAKKVNDVYKWLGKGFLQTAFTASAQKKIAVTNVDNSAASTTDAKGLIDQAISYACENTNDKLFLLSEKEVTTIDYGFDVYDSYGKGSTRIRIPTDYALANYSSKEYGYGGRWWLRSPYYDGSSYACYVDRDGWTTRNPVYVSEYGVVPALTISY